MANGVELAVGYVSIVADTSQMSTGINRAFARVGDDAQRHGVQMGQRMGQGAQRGFVFRPQQALTPGIAAADQAGRQMGQRMGTNMVGQLKQFMTASGLAATGILGATAALGAGMASAVKSTVDFQSQLNQLQGASRATAAEMGAINARARELGNDTQLAGTSATDAAAAMTELVKGGFNVSQAMTAAKGTLQLATAAQIDAASAATIQADALHAFALEADQAGRVSDVLANVANASTGSMQDFALGFQAGGAVMNQFGLEVEDAAATLGLLANAGIKSSDAGTLVKSMLLALASPSDQASAALDELGLKAFDATGNFRGMGPILEDLQRASERMTPEMYAMATSTAFGSDAARLAGIAAAQGGEGFEAMRTAVEREGAAAEVAAANMQGLPGVFERLSNTADRAKLSLGDLISGPVASIGNALNSGLNDAMDALEGKSGPGGPFGAMLDTARDLAPTIGDIASGIVSVAGAVGGAAWTGLSTVLQAAAEAGAALAPILEGIGGLVGSQTTLLAALAGAWAFHRFATPGLTRLNGAMETQAQRVRTATTAMGNFVTAQGRSLQLSQTSTVQMGRFATAINTIGQHVPALDRMQQSFFNGATSAERFGRMAGTASAAVSGLKTAAGGLVGALGGPWGAALAAATVGLTLWASSASESKQRADTLQEVNTRLTASYKDMFELLSLSGGEVDETVLAKANEQADALNQKLDTMRKGASPGDWLRAAGSDIFGIGDFDFGDAAEKQGQAEWVERMKTAMEDLGLTSKEMGEAITGSSLSWSTFVSHANAAGDAGRELVAELQPMRDEFLESQAAAERLTPGVAALQKEMEVLADSTSTAEEKTNALKAALDLLAGKAPDQAEAQKQYNDQVREIQEATAAAVDATKGFGEALVNSDGSVNTATANGSKLYEQLEGIRDATVGVAASGGDLQAAYEGNTRQFQALAQQLGLTEQQVRTMAEAMGLVPQRIDTLVTVNKDETIQDLALVKLQMESLPPNTPLTIDAITEEAETKLEAVGFTVERLPDNKGVRITQNGAEATASAIQEIINTMMNVPSEMVLSSAYRQLGAFDTNSFSSAGDAQRQRRGGADQNWFQYDPSTPGREEGGSIDAAGPKGQDGVPIVAAPGEHMWTVDDVRAVGGQQKMYQLRAMARRGLLRGFEEGGEVYDPLKQLPPAPAKPIDWTGYEDRHRFNPEMMIDTSTTSVSGPRDPASMNMKDLRSIIQQKPSDVYNPVQQQRRELRQNDEMWKFFSGGADLYSASFFSKGGAIQALEEGGVVAPAPGIDPRILAIDEAYRTSGRPYEYGPWDCSMYMSQIWGAMSGAGPGRHFNTESDFEALGFKPGYKAGALNIGIRRGGGGANSHMAGTLPNGVNVENSSNGSVYGPAAAGASDFPLQYYYEGPSNGIDMVTNPTGQPNLAGVPGNPGGPSQDQRDAAAGGTEHGTLAGAAPGEAAGLAAAGGSGTGDARTEGLIPAGAGNTAPAGSGLIGGITGMGVKVINAGIDMAAQAASMAASGAANAFAPGSGAAAGQAVQMGADVAKRAVEYGGEMIGIWGDALVEQVTPFGAPRWMATDVASFMPQPRGGTVATTTLEEGAQAAAQQQAAPAMPQPDPATGMTPHGQNQGIAPGPVAPGLTPATQAAPVGPNMDQGIGVAGQQAAGPAPGPVADPANPLLKLPFGVFDEGGMLQPGGIAVNMGTTPEPVLTQEQWDAVGANSARAPLYPGESSLDFSTHIQSVQVGDVDELQRTLDSRGRLAMMRYSARHGRS